MQKITGFYIVLYVSYLIYSRSEVAKNVFIGFIPFEEHMKLQNKTLIKLRKLINEEIEYRSGPRIVDFFNQFGSDDIYGEGFPSRWIYTDAKLQEINDTPKLDQCIQELFAPINFVEDMDKLDSLIENFNKYLVFDGWKIVRKKQNIILEPTADIDKVLGTERYVNGPENYFLAKEFEDIPLEQIVNDERIHQFLQSRLNETKMAIQHQLYLSAIFMCGSILEGILLYIESKFPKLFNQAKSSPKTKEGKIRPFAEWSLADSINVANEIGFLGADVKKFSHALRDFRNYIHPYEQMSQNFVPDEHTTNICFQVLKAALFQIHKKLKTIEN